MQNDFNKSLGPWLGKTMKLIDNKLEDILEENNLDLSKTQFIILKNVQVNEGICQNQLAFFADRNKSSLTRMINTLEKKNYLARVASKDDRRMNMLIITKEGERVLKNAEPFFLKIKNLIEIGLTEEEIESTINTLKKIQQNINGSVKGPMIK